MILLYKLKKFQYFQVIFLVFNENKLFLIRPRNELYNYVNKMSIITSNNVMGVFDMKIKGIYIYETTWGVMSYYLFSLLSTFYSLIP